MTTIIKDNILREVDIIKDREYIFRHSFDLLSNL